jgi:hypothetical protein
MEGVCWDFSSTSRVFFQVHPAFLPALQSLYVLNAIYPCTVVVEAPLLGLMY